MAMVVTPSRGRVDVPIFCHDAGGLALISGCSHKGNVLIKTRKSNGRIMRIVGLLKMGEVVVENAFSVEDFRPLFKRCFRHGILQAFTDILPHRDGISHRC